MARKATLRMAHRLIGGHGGHQDGRMENRRPTPQAGRVVYTAGAFGDPGKHADRVLMEIEGDIDGDYEVRVSSRPWYHYHPEDGGFRHPGLRRPCIG